MQGSSILICLPHRAAAAAFYIIHATFAQCFLSPGASCWEASSNSRGRKFTIFSRVFIGWWFLFSSSGRRCFPRLKFCQEKKNWPPNLYRWCVPRYFRTGVEITNFDRSTTAIKRLAKNLCLLWKLSTRQYFKAMTFVMIYEAHSLIAFLPFSTCSLNWWQIKSAYFAVLNSSTLHNKQTCITFFYWSRNKVEGGDKEIDRCRFVKSNLK